ncbi:outer membrane beta-barrel protein [Mucilaginibacter mali]|uniref:Outer membrane beta-barrel protein n=1 Tax=Mucilaginibacter mali TaxID=2740462 RepID=A0A7D4QHT0_9SPHI|nr:outer membrane beta-barrel family protein [Mucilaginibacter mali]QKJ28650.1 outer membrane beta-barrel protein [Mucilaginibacter mali]
MKNIYLLIVFIAVLAVNKAVGQSVPTGARISGKLVDANTGEVIDFATVALYKVGNDNMFKGTSSNDGGVFNLFSVPFGQYSLRISFVGYEKQSIDRIELDATHMVFNVGTVKLKPSGNALSEVVISDKKPQVEYGADQITYNVSESLQAEGAVATDILKNVPMVNVDINGNATIAGKRNTRIFIDGKPSDYMTANITDLLNVLPSDAIDKIEVMTNPPVKYSADGEGIINIVLKKGFKVGLNGTFAITGGSLGNYNINSYASYRTKTLSINSSYAFGESQNIGNSYSLRKNFFPDTLFYRNNYSGRDGNNFGHNFRTGANWDIDSTQNIRISTNLNFNRAGNLSYTDYHYLDNLAVESNLNKQNNSNHSNSFNYVMNADYTWKMSKSGEQLEASAMYSANSSGNNRFLARDYLDGNGLPISSKSPLEQTYDIDGANHGFEFKLDYDKPLKKPKNSISLGMDANLRTNDNDQEVNNYNFITKQYLTNTGLTNRFVFNSNIYSAYASLNLHTTNNWSFRIGGRGELTDMGFTLSSLAQKFNIKPYVNLFPNLSASRMFKEKYTVGLSYSERIARPREFALNPQIETQDSTNISFGNPNLHPSHTQQLDLSFGMFQKMWSIYPRLGYSSTSSIIERLTTVSPTGVSQSTYDNLASSQYYTVNVYGNYRPTKKITLNGGGTVGKVVYETTSVNAVSRNGYSINGRVGMTMDLPQRLAFEGNMSYYSNSSAQGRNAGSVSTSFGMRKVFMKNKLKLRMMAVNPFSNSNSITYTDGINFTRESFNSTRTRNFSMTISYNFTKVGRNTLEKNRKKDEPVPNIQP